MKPAALVCALFVLLALAAMAKNGYQPLFGYLLAVSLAMAAVFTRVAFARKETGDTSNE